MLLTLLKEGATVLTPNNRLANEVIDHFFRTKESCVQEKPSCLPYAVFLHNTFNHHCYKNATRHFPLLLSSQQQRYLWWQIINQDTPATFNPGLITEVQDAWSTCQRWQLDTDSPCFTYTSQTRLFQSWAQHFKAAVTQLSAMTEDELVNFFIHEKIAITAKTIIWYCFDDYTPQQRQFQQYLLDAGCTLHHLDLTSQSDNALANNVATDSNAYLYAASEEEDEYRTLVHWIHQRLAVGDKRIGVVVPDLQSQAPFLQRFLQQHLPPDAVNISLGQALSDFSLTAHALSWLSLDGETLTNHQARLLLFSPFLAGSQTELHCRAQALHECRALQEAMIDQSVFLGELKHMAPRLVQILASLPAYPTIASPDEWITAFTNRLNALGFPGECLFNSETYQCYQRFLSLFDELRSLHCISPQMTQTQALAALDTLAKTTIFQPKKSGALIQVLGLLEASGCVFDSLWVTGLTDECLPQKTRLSAFIPIQLQQEKLLPRASAAQELTLATKSVTRFIKSSPHCVFSYPRLTKDKPNLPSPLVSHLPLITLRLADSNQEPLPLEYYADSYQIDPGNHENIAGGATLLANQAKCPFRAFTAHRLHVKKAVYPSDGFNAMERGQIIHKVMEILWQTLGSQQSLLAISETALTTLIATAIEQALAPYLPLRTHSFSALVQAVEWRRLTRIVEAALEWEKQRPPFTIDALEQTFTLTLAEIPFNLRIDRLDQVADDKKWVIDYKTTIPSRAPWREDRPTEPQLLLYALLDETINTLLFAGLKADLVTCRGLSEDTLEVAGIARVKEDETWEEYREHWRAQLTTLAQEFHDGNCAPDPLSPSVCQQCDYQALCRFTTTP